MHGGEISGALVLAEICDVCPWAKSGFGIGCIELLTSAWTWGRTGSDQSVNHPSINPKTEIRSLLFCSYGTDSRVWSKIQCPKHLCCLLELCREELHIRSRRSLRSLLEHDPRYWWPLLVWCCAFTLSLARGTLLGLCFSAWRELNEKGAEKGCTERIVLGRLGSQDICQYM